MPDQAASITGPPEAGEVIVALTLRFRPGTADAVLAGIAPSIAPTRAEAGNRRFDVFRVTADPDTLLIFERWTGRAALQEHRRRPYTAAALALFAEQLVEPLADGRNVVYLTDATDIRDE